MSFLSDNISRVAADFARPTFHLGAPAGWMNDPNGTVFHDGWYHVFYQWNPGGDAWGDIHWGHARSRDLLAWERLPVALSPSRERGETHCYSGCLWLRRDATPMLFYTAIGPEMSDEHGAQQWVATGDESLISWQKLDSNPVLSNDIHPQPLTAWRDPFVFVDEAKTAMVLGGKLGGEAVITLYHARNNELTAWDYRGILFRHADNSLHSLECPNFFKLGEMWVLLVSPYRAVEFYVGDFDAPNGTFAPQSSGLLDGSDQFYATNVLVDETNRCLCWGWVRGFGENRGWNGCLSLPRELRIDENKQLRQRPACELEQLRGRRTRVFDVALERLEIADFVSPSLEIRAVIETKGACGLKLLSTNPQAASIEFACADGSLKLGDKTMRFERDTEEPLEIRLFLDRSVIEVFVDERATLTLVVAPVETKYRVEVWAQNAARLRELEAWEMNSGSARVFEMS